MGYVNNDGYDNLEINIQQWNIKIIKKMML